MPFRKSLRIGIVDQSSKPIRKLYNNVVWIKKASLPENTMYFGARHLESGGQLLFFPETVQDGWLEIPVSTEKKEPLRLVLELTASYDFGVWQPFLDGVPLSEPLDLHRSKPELTGFHLLDFWPDPGTHTLRPHCTGRHVHSTGLGIGDLHIQKVVKVEDGYAWKNIKTYSQIPLDIPTK